MAKAKAHYVCQSCGYGTAKWLGRCPECGAWETFVEEVATPSKAKTYLEVATAPVPKSFAEVAVGAEKARLCTGIGEFDRVLGGGIVPGSLILLGGEPGIGKSTIALDAGLKFARRGTPVFYVSGEESEAQVALRAQRLGSVTGGICVMTATALGGILTEARKLRPSLLIIDSIQTMYYEEMESAAGSAGQVRECTAQLLRFAKETGIAVLIIGHVTKEGNIAGPRLLEHMVDVVLQFEGDRSFSYRVLRALKNRFGSTSECGIFSMEAEGLAEVTNPSGLFLEKRTGEVSGTMVGSVLEGNRPILVEIQALLARTPFGLPRRTAVGMDYNRVNMLLAVLEKRMGMDFSTYDAYVNVVGGLKVTETAVDLAVVGALVSSLRNRPVAMGTIAIGEVGLTGEIRRVSMPERRIREAAKIGFTRFIVPVATRALPVITGATIIEVRDLAQALGAMGVAG